MLATRRPVMGDSRIIGTPSEIVLDEPAADRVADGPRANDSQHHQPRARARHPARRPHRLHCLPFPAVVGGSSGHGSRAIRAGPRRARCPVRSPARRTGRRRQPAVDARPTRVIPIPLVHDSHAPNNPPSPRRRRRREHEWRRSRRLSSPRPGLEPQPPGRPCRLRQIGMVRRSMGRQPARRPPCHSTSAPTRPSPDGSSWSACARTDAAPDGPRRDHGLPRSAEPGRDHGPPAFPGQAEGAGRSALEPRPRPVAAAFRQRQTDRLTLQLVKRSKDVAMST